MKRSLATVGAITILGVACSNPAPEPATPASAPPAAEARTAAPATHPLKEAYFGEQHLHTAYSLDAFIGGARLTPSDAYRFAKGEAVDVNGQKVRLRTPLDWAAVTDHAEYLGEMYSTLTEGATGVRFGPAPGPPRSPSGPRRGQTTPISIGSRS